MNDAIACSLSRGGMSSRAATSSIVATQHVPALEEEGVEHLVLGAEVVVDEAVGDARLVGDVRDAAAVEALAREHAHGGVEDLAALVGRGLGAGGDGHQACTSPRTGRRGGGRARAAWPGSRPGASKSRSATITPSSSGAWARTTPHGSTIIERPPERSPGGCSPTWLAATTNAWFSIARARSEHLPVVARGGQREGGGDGDHPRAARAQRAVELGEAQVVADGQAQPGAVRQLARRRPRRPALSCSDSR